MRAPEFCGRHLAAPLHEAGRGVLIAPVLTSRALDGAVRRPRLAFANELADFPQTECR